MNNKFGYTKIEILVIVVLLGIVAFITINKTSYAFAIDNSAADEVKKLIEIQAQEYGEDNLDLFNESHITYISVGDLVDNNYLFGNQDGLITNPANGNESYNDNKIKLEYVESKNKIVATMID